MTQTQPVRLDLDRVRKLKVKHKHIRDAVRASGKSVGELLNDPFGGYPFLLQALLLPGAAVGESVSLDKASDLIDVYIEKHGNIEGLTKALVQALSGYLRIELTPSDEEDPTSEGTSPNEPALVTPGHEPAAA
jgi:hypothetical protein